MRSLEDSVFAIECNNNIGTYFFLTGFLVLNVGAFEKIHGGFVVLQTIIIWCHSFYS